MESWLFGGELFKCSEFFSDCLGEIYVEIKNVEVSGMRTGSCIFIKTATVAR